MKLAIVTHNGETVSQHFGRSPYYKIYTIEDGDAREVELRERHTGHFAPNSGPHHQHQHQHHEEDHPHGEGHGFGREAGRKHASMVEEISDCQVLIAGGMGRGAYNHFAQAGIEVILTNFREINDAVNAYVKGDLDNLVDERTH